MSDKQDRDALLKASIELVDTKMQAGIATLAYMAPDSVKSLTKAIENNVAAARHEAAGDTLQASQERTTGKHSLDAELLKAIEEANRKATSPADKGKLAAAVAGMTGMNIQEAEEALNTARVADQERSVFARMTGSLPASEKAEYAAIGDKLKVQSDNALSLSVAAAQGDLYLDDLAKMGVRNNPNQHIDDKTRRKLENTIEQIGGPAGDAIATIAYNSPALANEIIKKADAFALDKSAKNNEALAGALLAGAEDISRRSGGKDDSVVTALATLFGGDKNEIRTQLHTAAAEGARANHEGDYRLAAEARREQQASESALLANVKLGLANNQPQQPEQAAPAQRTDIKTAVYTTSTPTEPAAVEPVVQPAKTNVAAEHRHTIAVEGGGSMDIADLQRAILEKNKNADLGKTGKDGNGVDNDLGEKTLAALMALRKSEGKDDTQLAINKSEFAELSALAAKYKTEHAALVQNKEQKPRGAVPNGNGTTPRAVSADNQAAEPVAAKPTTLGQEIIADQNGKFEIITRSPSGRGAITDHLNKAPGGPEMVITDSGIMGTVTLENGKQMFHRLTEEQQTEQNNRNMLFAVTGDKKALDGNKEEVAKVIKDLQHKYNFHDENGQFDKETKDFLAVQVNNNASILDIFTKTDLLAAQQAGAADGKKGDGAPLDAKTMNAMMAEFAKNNKIDLAAVTTKTERDVATRVTANQTPGQSSPHNSNSRA